MEESPLQIAARTLETLVAVEAANLLWEAPSSQVLAVAMS